MKIDFFKATLVAVYDVATPRGETREILVRTPAVFNNNNVVVEFEQEFAIRVMPQRFHLLEGLTTGDTVKVYAWLNSKPYVNASGKHKLHLSLNLSHLEKTSL